MGLGSYPTVSLGAAREAASEARKLVSVGTDPIEVKQSLRIQRKLDTVRAVKWDDVLTQFLDSHEGAWKNKKHRQQWRNTLDAYAKTVLSAVPISSVGTSEITKILDPIWTLKPETASRVRGRIERVLDWARVRGYRDGENPARWRGHLDKIYPARTKVRKVKHHAAVPIDELPELYGRLVEAKGVAAKALRFVILTAARPGEVTGGQPLTNCESVIPAPSSETVRERTSSYRMAHFVASASYAFLTNSTTATSGCLTRRSPSSRRMRLSMLKESVPLSRSGGLVVMIEGQLRC